MNKFILSFIRIKCIRSFLLCVLRCRQSKKFKLYLKNADEKKLQIGFGTNLLKGWLNTGLSLREMWYGAYLDAGKPYPLPDASFDYVFSEHLFEHLTYKQAQNMLKESYRILKPGGVMRLATPDLKFLIKVYQEPEKPLHKAYMEYSTKHFSMKDNVMPSTPVYLISRFHTSWGHQIIYDKETLTGLLEQVGFKDICTCAVGESKHIALTGIEGHTNVLPIEYNILETMILEGTK